MKYQDFKKTTGFALIELLVVASIISLLSSIAMVSMDNARVKARMVALNLNVKTLFNESALYYADNNNYIGSEESGPCGTVGGFLSTEKSQEVLSEIESISNLLATNNSFYCKVEENEWSLALSTLSLNREDEIVCASTRRGQVLLIENSNDTPVSDYFSTGNCTLD